MGKRKWVPLESNPEVLNTFVQGLGLDTSKYCFADVFGLDEDLLSMVPQPVLAVIMCFPYTEESGAAAKKEDTEIAAAATATADSASAVYKPFYMKQTIGNACGTIAVLHSIGNNLAELNPAAGSFLQSFFDATQGKSPEEVGQYLEIPPEGAPDITTAHQAAAAEGATAAPAAEDEVNLHFVAFINKNGVLYQLDGMRQAPVAHGPTSAATLLQDAAKVVKQFVDRAKGAVQFNLLALTATPAEDDS